KIDSLVRVRDGSQKDRELNAFRVRSTSLSFSDSQQRDVRNRQENGIGVVGRMACQTNDHFKLCFLQPPLWIPDHGEPATTAAQYNFSPIRNDSGPRGRPVEKIKVVH